MPCDPTNAQPIGIATLGCCIPSILCCPRDPTEDPQYNFCLFRVWTRHTVGRVIHGVQSCTHWNPQEDNCLSGDRTFWLGWHTDAVASPPIPAHNGGINPWTGEAAGDGIALNVQDGSVQARSQLDIDNGRVNTVNPANIGAETQQLYDLVSPSILDAFGTVTYARFEADGTPNQVPLALAPSIAVGPFDSHNPIIAPIPSGYNPDCTAMVGGVNGSFPSSIVASKGYFRPYGNYALSKWSVREMAGGIPQNNQCFQWIIELLECRIGIGQTWEFTEAIGETLGPSIAQIITGCNAGPRVETIVWLAQKDVGCPNLAP